jgi:TonB family protein
MRGPSVIAVVVACIAGVACIGCSRGNAKQSPPASEAPKPSPPNQSGLPSGTGQQMGPLFFDPKASDFTRWINHFKDEVYRNWISPQPALEGERGHVDIEFTVEENGFVSQCRILTSSTNPALDKAAKNALELGRYLPLPDDYGPAWVTMRASFFYNEPPAGS